MANIGAERGKKFFIDKLAALRGGGTQALKIDILNAAFQDQVSVFAQEDFFVAAALVKAIESSLAADTSMGMVIEDVKARYALARPSALTAPETLSAEALEARTASIKGQMKNIAAIRSGDSEPVSNQDPDAVAGQAAINDAVTAAYASEGVALDEHGRENIDMVKDWKVRRDASAEGKRVLGLLPADFDTSQITEEEEPEVEEQKMADLVVGPDGGITIQCPDCGSQSILPLGGGLYACLGTGPSDCESEFAADFTLEDILQSGAEPTEMETEMEKVAPTIIAPGKFTRVERRTIQQVPK